ncbi:MAG TPA: sugar ABC transporter substrate-binding protein [Bacillota bacterium]|nr:sugar ABC transporter substrate-binding protein [Bacillota bacterium]
MLMVLTISVNAAEQVTIVYQNWTANEIPIERELIREFEDTHPGIKIELATTPVEQMHDKLLLLTRAGRAPDVMQTIPEWIVEFAENGVVAAMEDLLDPTEYEQFSSTFIPAAWGMAQWKTKTYGVPWRFGASATFINSKLRREAGLPVPEKWTWDEFVDYAAKLTDASKGVYGFGVPGASVDLGSSWCWSAFLFQNGGRLVDENGEVAIDNEKAIEALEFYVGLLRDKQVMPPNTTSLSAKDITDLFGNNKLGMWQNGSWYIDTMKVAYPNLEFDVAPLPINVSDGSPAGGTLLSISPQTKNTKAALEFVRFMTSEEIISKWAKSGHHMPPVEAVLNQPFMQEGPMSVFVAQAREPNTYVIGNLPEFTSLATSLQVAIEKAFAGSSDPGQALKQAAAEWREVMNKYK